jgi:hypothetical protein
MEKGFSPQNRVQALLIPLLVAVARCWFIRSWSLIPQELPYHGQTGKEQRELLLPASGNRPLDFTGFK